MDKNLEKAFYWTERAAVHGDRDARNNPAELFYETGTVVERNIPKAMEWNKKAAEAGHSEAMEKLKKMQTERTKGNDKKTV